MRTRPGPASLSFLKVTVWIRLTVPGRESLYSAGSLPPPMVTRRIICARRSTGSLAATGMCWPYCCFENASGSSDAIRKWCRELAASNVTAPLILRLFESDSMTISCNLLCYTISTKPYVWHLLLFKVLFFFCSQTGGMRIGNIYAWGSGMFPQPNNIWARALLTLLAQMSRWIKSQRSNVYESKNSWTWHSLPVSSSSFKLNNCNLTTAARKLHSDGWNWNEGG